MIPAIVLVGGLGTRLRAISGDTPKPLMPIGERPFLEYVLDMLIDAQVSPICLATSYRHELFRKQFAATYRGTSLLYSVEHEPLGTGGAILQCFNDYHLPTALVLNGDTLFRLSISALVQSHISAKSRLTLALRSVPDVSRYGAVTCDSDDRIVAFEEKGTVRQGFVNGGTYVVDRSIFEFVDLPAKFSFEIDFLQKYVSTLRPLGVVSDGYFVDIGIPEDLERARREMLRG